MNVTIDRRLIDNRTPRYRLPKTHKHFDIGKSLLKKNLLKEAFDHFRESIRSSNDRETDILICLYKRLVVNYESQEIRTMIAEIHALAGDYKEAISELEEAFEIDPRHTRIYAILGRIYAKAGQKLRIRNIFEAAVDAGIWDPVVIDMLPKIYLEELNFEKNVAFYKRLIQAFPNQHSYYKVLSELYLRARNYDGAAEALDALLTTAPYSAPELVEPLTRLVRQSPRNLRCREALVKVLLKTCQPLEAIQHIQDLVKYNPTRLEEMLALLKKASDQYPNTFEILLLTAEVCVSLSRFSEATAQLREIFKNIPDKSIELIPVLERILDAFSNQLLAIALLGDIYYRSGNIEKALFYYNQVIDIAGTDPEVETKLAHLHEAPGKHRDYATYLLAKIKQNQGDFGAAETLAEKLLGTPEWLRARLLIAKIQLSQQKYTNAHHDLLNAVEKEPFNWDVHEGLRQAFNEMISTQHSHTGLAYLLQDQPLRALEAFQKEKNSDTDNLVTQRLIARTLMEMGRYDLATNQMQKLLEKLGPGDILETNTSRYFLAVNFLHLGKLSHALHHLDLIFENDLHFHNISQALDRYRRESNLDLRGTVLVGATFQPDNLGQFSPTVIPNLENQIYLKKQKKWQAMGFSQTHNNQGVEALIQNQVKSAEEAFHLALQMDPEFTAAYTNLAYLYVTQNAFSQADELLKRALAINPEFEAAYLVDALAKLIQQQPDLALDALFKCTKIKDHSPFVHLLIGDAFFQRKNIEPALVHWKTAEDVDHLAHLVRRRCRYLEPMPTHPNYWWALTPSPLRRLCGG